MSTLQPNMEAIVIPGAINGAAIVGDLLNRIEDKLSRSCDLRPVDVYSGYRAKVSIELQLLDVYPVDVVQEIQVGSIDPRQDVQHITLSPDVDGEPQQPNLERPVDPAGVTEEQRERRQYVSRTRGQKSA
jgi:hypothetical protein